MIDMFLNELLKHTTFFVKCFFIDGIRHGDAVPGHH